MTDRNYEVIQGGVVPIKAWVQGVQLEWEARQQLINVAKLPFIHKHVAVMPDVHWGMGATIGSVIPTYGAIVPAAVGVDIGCGMMAVRTALTANDLPENLRELREAIEKAVPHGRTKHGQVGDKGGWHRDIPRSVGQVFREELGSDLTAIFDAHPKLKSKRVNSLSHLGTLGSGNHFIEVCLDESNNVWVMLHSGSRGIGNRLGSYFIQLAKEDMRKWFINLPDSNLAYFSEGTEHFGDYWFAVDWAQRFARQNRELMMDAVLDAIAQTIKPRQALRIRTREEAINCHHNYVSRENHFGKNILVTRKGAVRAREGELGIIPGSMGVKSYIVRGKGNKDSFQSCSHGAGRVMSRSQAKRQFTVADHEKATEGVECRKDINVIDETPGAYKDIDAVMEAQKDLVEIVHTLKQVVCVKG